MSPQVIHHASVKYPHLIYITPLFVAIHLCEMIWAILFCNICIVVNFKPTMNASLKNSVLKMEICNPCFIFVIVDNWAYFIWQSI